MFDLWTIVTVMKTVYVLTLSDQVLSKIHPEKRKKFYGQRANKTEKQEFEGKIERKIEGKRADNVQCWEMWK